MERTGVSEGLRVRSRNAGPSHRIPIFSRAMVAFLACLAAAAGIGALEPYDLRIGMKPDEVVAVYTSLRSCSNSAFTEEPGSMAWDAQLFDRNARIGVIFDQGLSNRVEIRIFLEAGDDGKDALQVLADEQTSACGPPETGVDGTLRWNSGTASTTLVVEEAQGDREIVLGKHARR